MTTLPIEPLVRQPRKPSLAFSFESATRQLFRTSGGRPFAFRVWFWTAMAMSVALFIGLPFIAPGYGEFLTITNEINEATLSGEAIDPELSSAMLAAMGGMVPGYLLIMLGPWFAAIAGEAALHRKLFRDEEHDRIPLRFGRDEFRILLSQLAVYGLMLLAYFAAILLTVITFGIGAIVAIPALFFFLVWLPLRHCTAGALSVHDDAIRIKQSRATTKHRAGPLFGAYLFVWFVGYVAIYGVLITVVLLIAGDAAIIGAASGLGGDTDSIAGFGERLRNPVFMLLAVLGIVAYAAVASLWYLTQSGVGAYALRWYEADIPHNVFD